MPLQSKKAASSGLPSKKKKNMSKLVEKWSSIRQQELEEEEESEEEDQLVVQVRLAEEERECVKRSVTLTLFVVQVRSNKGCCVGRCVSCGDKRVCVCVWGGGGGRLKPHVEVSFK